MFTWIKRVFLGIAVLGLLAAAPVQAQEGPGNSAGHRPGDVVPGQYIVVLHDDVTNARGAANDMARAYGLELGHIYSVALKGFSAQIPDAMVAALAADPDVAYIEADQRVQAFAQTVPTGIERIFAEYNSNVMIDGNDDYRIDVDVAVLDTGIDIDHPDLNVFSRTNCARGGPFGGGCKDNDGDDGNGHGTHVAGTIGALDNGVGVVGVAPGARLWAVRVLDNRGSGYISWIVAGIDWVTARAQDIEVANMSLGCECSSAALDTAIANSVAAGVTYAVAAGNSNKDAATFSPANHPDVITVSALADFDGGTGGSALWQDDCTNRNVQDLDDTGADFSNWGDDVEVTAPGVCIESTWNNGGTYTISGTSMASPHVAGAAALLAASGFTDPGLIRQTIIDTGNTYSLADGGWDDDSPDGAKEPLLDVSNTTTYDPVTVPGPGGGGGGNTAPVANVDAESTPQDTAVIIDVLFNDTDSDNDPLTVGWVTQGTDGSVVINGDNTVTYTPDSAFSGADSFTYVANDGTYDSNEATVTVTVEAAGGGGGDITLTATRRKVKGTKYVDLVWSEATSPNVDVWRKKGSLAFTLAFTTENDGTHTDNLGKGGGTYTYKLCNEGTSTCSNEATVTF